jgi:uncharacterized tellurite resistance protein B-like protein
MDKINLSADVMQEIYKHRLNEIIELDKLGRATHEDFIEIFTDAFTLNGKRNDEMFEKYNAIAEMCIEYGNKIISMQKSISRERRIRDLFLKNNDLDWKYDNFEARILERLYEVK